MHLLETLAGDMGVDCRGRDIGVTQQHLDRAQVRAVVEQVVAKAWRSVWGDGAVARPACSAYFLTMLQNITRDIAVPGWTPLLVTNKATLGR